jgi:hypothetical protein
MVHCRESPSITTSSTRVEENLVPEIVMPG